MLRVWTLFLALVTAESAYSRAMVEQFYIDHTGARVSRGTNHSPIAYGSQDQRFFFLGHFGYVDNSQLYRYNNPWGNWVWGMGTAGFLGDFVPTPTDDPETVSTPQPVSEPGTFAILLMALMFLIVARQLTAKRSAL